MRHPVTGNPTAWRRTDRTPLASPSGLASRRTVRPTRLLACPALQPLDFHSEWTEERGPSKRMRGIQAVPFKPVKVHENGSLSTPRAHETVQHLGHLANGCARSRASSSSIAGTRRMLSWNGWDIEERGESELCAGTGIPERHKLPVLAGQDGDVAFRAKHRGTYDERAAGHLGLDVEN